MFCTVYRTRRKGEKLPPDAIQATGAVARLSFKRHPLGEPTYWAKIFDVVTGELKGHLENAQIKLIEDGIKIAGWEASFENKPQVWWCVPLTPEQNTELKAALERIRPVRR